MRDKHGGGGGITTRWCTATSASGTDGDDSGAGSEAAVRSLLVWERFFDDAAHGAGALCVFHSSRGARTGPVTVDTGFGAGVVLRAAFGPTGKAANGDSAGTTCGAWVTDSSGRVCLDIEAQGGLVLVPA